MSYQQQSKRLQFGNMMQQTNTVISPFDAEEKVAEIRIIINQVRQMY